MSGALCSDALCPGALCPEAVCPGALCPEAVCPGALARDGIVFVSPFILLLCGILIIIITL